MQQKVLNEDINLSGLFNGCPSGYQELGFLPKSLNFRHRSKVGVHSDVNSSLLRIRRHYFH